MDKVDNYILWQLVPNSMNSEHETKFPNGYHSLMTNNLICIEPKTYVQSLWMKLF
jgi:hypothetical protein